MHTTFRSPRFSINTNQDFARVLNERVSQYFSQKNKSKHANASMVFKTLFMLSLYLFPLVMLLWVSNPWISILLWFMAGIGMAGVGLSVMHDANHGAYSSNRFVNKMVGGVLNIIGGNPTNWKIQHNVLHHTFTNVDGFDEDIAPPIPILRFSPHSAWKPVHKYQHIYAWFFYPLMTIMWYLTKDYKQAIRYHKQGLTASQGLTLSQHLFNIIFWKVVYTLLFIVIPIFANDSDMEYEMDDVYSLTLSYFVSCDFIDNEFVYHTDTKIIGKSNHQRNDRNIANYYGIRSQRNLNNCPEYMSLQRARENKLNKLGI